MIRLHYSAKHRAFIACHNEISVALYDRDKDVPELLKRIDLMGDIGPKVEFSEELWAEILNIGTVIDDG